MGGSSKGARPAPSAPQVANIIPSPAIGPVQQPNPAPAENYAPYYAGQGLNGMRQAVMQSYPTGINRMAFNPQAAQSMYAAPRAPQIFRPQYAPPVPMAAPQAAPQQAEADKMRQELDAMRAWQSQMQNGGGGGSGGNG